MFLIDGFLGDAGNLPAWLLLRLRRGGCAVRRCGTGAGLGDPGGHLCHGYGRVLRGLRLLRQRWGQGQRQYEEGD